MGSTGAEKPGIRTLRARSRKLWHASCRPHIEPSTLRDSSGTGRRSRRYSRPACEHPGASGSSCESHALSANWQAWTCDNHTRGTARVLQPEGASSLCGRKDALRGICLPTGKSRSSASFLWDGAFIFEPVASGKDSRNFVPKPDSTDYRKTTRNCLCNGITICQRVALAAVAPLGASVVVRSARIAAGG